MSEAKNGKTALATGNSRRLGPPRRLASRDSSASLLGGLRGLGTGQFVRHLPTPKGGMALVPTWSSTSRFVALASLQEIVVYDRLRRTSHRSRYLASEIPVGKVALAFDGDGQQLVVSQTDATWGEPTTFVIDLMSVAKARGRALPCPGCQSLFWSRVAADRASQAAAQAAVIAELADLKD